MQGLAENQKKILEFLLDHPVGATADELAAHLRVTKTAAKEHLVKLESLGLLNYEDRNLGVGRPRRYYKLSAQGSEVFPRQYSWLSNILLEFLSEDLGGAQTEKMMKTLALRVVDSMKDRFHPAQPSAENLAEITKSLNELGYRAVLKQSDVRKGAIIEASNCVYHSVAKTHPQLCSFDIEFIKKTSGSANVKLESCIARGGAVCRFCIRKS